VKVFTRLWRSRGWWALLVVLTTLFAVLGYLVGPPQDREATPEYLARNTLVLSDAGGRALSVDRVQLELTSGPIPATVAFELGFTDILEFLDDVTVVTNDRIGTIEISTVQPDELTATDLVSTYIDRYLEARQLELVEAQNLEIERIDIEKAAVEAQILAVDFEIDRQLSAADASSPIGPDVRQPTTQTILIARKQALVANYSDLLRSEREVARLADPLVTVTGKTIVEESLVGGFSTPLNKGVMGVVGAIFGLAIALAIVALAYKLDDRVDNRDEAESAYGSTVLTDIPRIPLGLRRRSDVVTFDEPDAPASGAYRHLRTMMSAISRDQAPSAGLASVCLITSAHSAEGKSLSTANLAAAYSDSGADVIVVSGDLRRPAIHRLLGAQGEGKGILEVPSGVTAHELEAQLVRTSLPRVRMLSHGAPVNNPGELLASRRDVIARCRELADIVLIDAPPALIGNDVAELLPAVDFVLVTVRLHYTQTGQARATRRLLRSLGSNLIGVALVESSDETRRRYQYGSRTTTSRSARVTSRIGKGEEARDRVDIEVYPTPGSTPIAARDERELVAVTPAAAALDGVEVIDDEALTHEIEDVLNLQTTSAWSRHRTK